MLGDGLLARELLEVMLCAGSTCPGEDSSIGDIVSSSVATGTAPPSSSGGSDKTPTLAISSDRSSCCLYSRAFIEHISLLLEEEGSSEATRDERLMEGKSPSILNVFAHHLLTNCPVPCCRCCSVSSQPLHAVDHRASPPRGATLHS